MIDESQKPTTQGYRDGWDRIWNPIHPSKPHPDISIHASEDRYIAPDGRSIAGEDVARQIRDGETYSYAAARLLGLVVE